MLLVIDCHGEIRLVTASVLPSRGTQGVWGKWRWRWRGRQQPQESGHLTNTNKDDDSTNNDEKGRFFSWLSSLSPAGPVLQSRPTNEWEAEKSKVVLTI